MKMFGESGSIVDAFLTLALYGGDLSASRSAHFTSTRIAQGIH